MSVFIHADDYGLSRGITDNILKSVDEGLSSTSIIANGYAFDYAIEEYQKRPNLSLTCHLNFVEGIPVSPPDKVDLLLNSKGCFSNSFISLWKKYLFADFNKRVMLKNQIRLEIDNQIKKISNAIGKDKPIKIDSHQHLHIIPFIFEALVELKDVYDYSYIRIPQETFFVHYENLMSFSNYLGSNIIKHLLLNRLSRGYKETLSREGINYCDYFIGVLFTGRMSEKVVRSALSNLTIKKKSEIVEILFHPGGAVKGEEKLWINDYDSLQYYFSTWREMERNALSSEYLQSILTKSHIY